MQERANLLVVGGGASGLAFALCYARLGLSVRIIEKRPSRSLVQKATGVAQGAWHQLAEFGITEKIIGDAFPMTQFVFHDNAKLVAQIKVPPVNGEPPAHLYPQAKLEEAMEEALASYGVSIEYGRQFVGVVDEGDKAKVSIVHNDETECMEVDWLIAADGSRSDVRSFLRIPFVGRDYPEDWSVAEIRSEQWPTEIQAQLFLQSDGVGFFLSRPSHGVVQGILNAKGAADKLCNTFPDATLLYERQFKVSLRRVLSPRHGRVWLIGDAAHVQSPVGGQGVNLAIWDGVTLARALADGRTDVERTLRRRAQSVLRFTDFDYRMLSAKSRMIRYPRNLYWGFAARYPILAAWFFKLISGKW
ncbi:FAD-dependent monooxygenase [Rhizobium sp. CFBP 8762]|uniref:FAD-dependent oxidoreductase n=1 Tax=Rhizobium sp. CFBP 8762 TaxID=2775279 RepID=UPI00177E04DA|nr:NAD(P)/FAD-dependent oxidoreductase [Rhizobium sp. CFBP 8762]MBD8556420.1 FAD-dependent monooxygenase [Rhizobium sp. CFBP 8762]